MTSVVITDAASVLQNSTVQAAYCGADPSFNLCLGICPNPDVSGVGVRAAFYSQSVANVILIWLSPDDAAGAQWSSAVLTAALVVPAIYAKLQRNLTLHHAVLVLNFSTLSTIASVAAAPMVPIWRRVTGMDRLGEAFSRETEDRTRGRIILSIAMLTTIILQWCWAVMLFVHPYYTQIPCSGTTVIYFLIGSSTADDINSKYFGAWASWLLLCMASSLIFGVVMVFSSPSRVHDQEIEYLLDLPPDPTKQELIQYYGYILAKFLWPSHDKHFITRCLIRLSHVVAVFIAVGFAVLSELQIRANNILEGEDNIFSFSQGAALLLALAPVWPIVIAWARKRHRASLRVASSPYGASPRSLGGSTRLPSEGEHIISPETPRSLNAPLMRPRSVSDLQRYSSPYGESSHGSGPSGSSYFGRGSPGRGTYSRVPLPGDVVFDEEVDEQMSPDHYISPGTPSKQYPRPTSGLGLRRTASSQDDIPLRDMGSDTMGNSGRRRLTFSKSNLGLPRYSGS